MNNKQHKTQMFKVIHAIVNEDWLRVNQVDKNEFLESIQDVGCELLLDKGTITVECDLDQFHNVLNKFSDENKELKRNEQTKIHIGFKKSFETEDIYDDQIIMDGYLWQYMKKIYGFEIEAEEKKHGLSVIEGMSDHEIVTIILKPKLRKKPDSMDVQERIFQMKDYISSLTCIVSSSVVVESVRKVNLTKTQFADLARYIEEKYADVILMMVGNVIRIIGPSERCEKVQRRLQRTSMGLQSRSIVDRPFSSLHTDFKSMFSPKNGRNAIPKVEPVDVDFFSDERIQPLAVKSEEELKSVEGKVYDEKNDNEQVDNEQHDDDDYNEPHDDDDYNEQHDDDDNEKHDDDNEQHDDDNEQHDDDDNEKHDDDDEQDYALHTDDKKDYEHIKDDELRENKDDKIKNDDGLVVHDDGDDDDDDIENDYNQLKNYDDFYEDEEESENEKQTVENVIELNDEASLAHALNFTKIDISQAEPNHTPMENDYFNSSTSFARQKQQTRSNCDETRDRPNEKLERTKGIKDGASNISNEHPRITANWIIPSRSSWSINFNDEPVNIPEALDLKKKELPTKPRKRLPDIAYEKDDTGSSALDSYSYLGRVAQDTSMKDAEGSIPLTPDINATKNWKQSLPTKGKIANPLFGEKVQNKDEKGHISKNERKQKLKFDSDSE